MTTKPKFAAPTDNPYYPDFAPDDHFVHALDPNVRDEPWYSSEYCEICGRLSSCSDVDLWTEFPLYCPYRNKPIWHHMCSPHCRAIVLAAHTEECDRFRANEKKNH